MKIFPITFDIYRKEIKDSLKDRSVVLLNTEFAVIKSTVPSGSITIRDLSNGINYLMLEINNENIPVSLFKNTREYSRYGSRSTDKIDLINGFYLENRFKDCENDIRKQLVENSDKQLYLGNWRVFKKPTVTKFIHNVSHKSRVLISGKLDYSYNMLYINNPSIGDGDYVIENSLYPDQKIDFTIKDNNRMLLKEFTITPYDMNVIVNKVVFIKNILGLNPVIETL
jgi:hypothetical protein